MQRRVPQSVRNLGEGIAIVTDQLFRFVDFERREVLHYRLPRAFAEHGLDVSFREEHRVRHVRDRYRAVSVLYEVRLDALDQFVGVFRLFFVSFV